MSNFPNVVNLNQAPAVAGDFASQNPRASLLAGEGKIVAPASGIIVGNFAFLQRVGVAGNEVDTLSQSFTSGAEVGFVAREEQALITAYLAGNSTVIPQGFMVTPYSRGDFYARFAGGATPGAAVFADETTGAAQSGSGTTSFTGSVGFTGTASLGTVAGQAQLTIATITGGSLLTIGDTVTGTGISAGTTVTGLVSGTASTVGAVYSLSAAVTTEAAEAVTSTSTTLNVTAVSAGEINVGDILSNGSVIAALGTGVGLVGTYILAAPINLASGTLTVPAGVIATQFTVASFANPGEIAKITAWY